MKTALDHSCKPGPVSASLRLPTYKTVFMSRLTHSVAGLRLSLERTGGERSERVPVPPERDKSAFFDSSYERTYFRYAGGRTKGRNYG